MNAYLSLECVGRMMKQSRPRISCVTLTNTSPSAKLHQKTRRDRHGLRLATILDPTLPCVAAPPEGPWNTLQASRMGHSLLASHQHCLNACAHSPLDDGPAHGDVEVVADLSRELRVGVPAEHNQVRQVLLPRQRRPTFCRVSATQGKVFSPGARRRRAA